ncbi:MAG: PRD domain-containing protein [Thermoanaerobacteraceae bacterium]|nr:PRD domain-containing protein [Thermoanaerobacteraceae bacterium]
MHKFQIVKVFNNNVVLAWDKIRMEEAVLVGKGLGFGTKLKYIIKEDKVEKVFYFVDKDKINQLNHFNKDIIGITEEIISMVSQTLEEPLNEHIHVALADHIGFTLERLQMGLEITNPFMEEIKALYSKEYELACRSAKMIEEKFGVEIPHGEKGFITMHIHSARVNRELSRTVKNTTMINKIVEITEQELQIKLDRNNINYARLVIHLRFALDRMASGTFIKNPLLDKIKQEFANSYKISKKIAKYIYERTGKVPSKDELGYLTLHIQRIKESLIERCIQ